MKQKPKKKVEFTLPWPPSANKMYKPCQRTKRGRSRSTGRFYCQKYLTQALTEETKNYYDLCYFEIYRQSGMKIPKFYKKVRMLIEFFPRRNGGWDASNFRKAPEDALVKAEVIIDDSVKYLIPGAPIIHKRVPRDTQPYIKITLEEI